MLALPLIPPQGDMMQPHFQPRSASPPPRQNGADHRQPRHEHHHNNNRSPAHNAQSPLALLTAEENAIAARKAAIRSFGASWIRPPGVLKTLQAQREEEAEMAEAEEQARQEQGLRDLQARQEVEEARTRAQEAGAAAAEGEVEGWAERDLDQEIPDADAEPTTEVTFNEDSMLEGSRIEPDLDRNQYDAREEAELTGAAREEEELGIDHERNLDDSVPEAGSYQHTDTEEEDSSSGEEDENSSSELHNSMEAASVRGATRPPRSGLETNTGFSMSGALQGGLQERLRAQTEHGAETLARSPGNLNLSSSILESSFVGSSPVVQRGRGGAARRRGRWS